MTHQDLRSERTDEGGSMGRGLAGDGEGRCGNCAVGQREDEKGVGRAENGSREACISAHDG